jgi:hypothetical protein
MSRESWKGLLASALIAVVAVVVDGCSSDSGGGNNTMAGDGGAEASHPVRRINDGGTRVDSGGSSGGAIDDSMAPAPFDGTSGKPCSSNADCGTTGTNVCSNTYSGKLNTVNGVASPQLWPTPLCMVPLPTVAGVGNCDPGDVGLQFCDSADPMDPASNGICLPITTPQQAGPTNGVCLPHCTFGADGSPAVGCPGKDTCNALTYELDLTTNMVLGHGFCQGSCQADADCSALGAGWVCQVDAGLCTKTKKLRTKAIGTSCLNSGSGATPIASSDTETGACVCPFSGTKATAFYCTSSCVVGGTSCPNGYVCDALLPGGQLMFGGADGGNVVLPGPPMQNPGLAGLCLAPCTNPEGGVVDAGSGDAAAADGGSPSACPGSSNFPPLSQCTVPTDTIGSVAGPDCLPLP